ncbi:hypothetical protein BTVI_73998 [Pitangus sulphuratus]|nr:hypothetical protein BTVI_73998 [Pitangus sulphuratus]
METIPSSSKIDPPLAKADPIGISGSHLWDSVFKKAEGKKRQLQQELETALQTPRSIKKEWEKILEKFGNPNTTAWPTNSSLKMEAAHYEMLSSDQETFWESK